VSSVPGESWAQCLAGRSLGPPAEDFTPSEVQPKAAWQGSLVEGVHLGVQPSGNLALLTVSTQVGHLGALDRWLKWRKQHISAGSQKKKQLWQVAFMRGECMAVLL